MQFSFEESHSTSQKLIDEYSGEYWESKDCNSYEVAEIASEEFSKNEDVNINTVWSMNSSDYEICQAIGFGSSAIVYLATYKPSGQLLAVKMLDLDRCDTQRVDTQLEELRREISVMSLSKHLNILKILTSFVDKDKLWIVTPYLSGGSCLDILKNGFKNGIDDEQIIATILQQTTEALHYIQKNGNIHRDIKAGNLLIDSSGVVQLADFGVASTLLEADQRKVRKTFVGTPCWMAPEVMEMNPSGYDGKADIWSLGITALELALGSAPYAKFPPMKIIYMTLTNPPPSLPKDNERKFSKAFRSFIEMCLQKDPYKRPTTEQLLKHPFLKSAKRPSYIAENLLTKVVPVHLRAKPVNNESRFEESKEHCSDAPEWSFNTDNNDLYAGQLPIEIPEQGTRSRRKGRFIVLDDQANVCGSTDENTSPSTADDHDGSGCASRHSSNSDDQCVRKGRFSLVDDSSTHTIKASTSDTSVPIVCMNDNGGSVRIGRFQVDKDDSSGSTNNDTMLTSPVGQVLDTMQLPSAILAHPSHIDQLLLLNDLMRQHLIELRSMVSNNLYHDANQHNPHQRSYSSDRAERPSTLRKAHAHNSSLSHAKDIFERQI